MLTAALRHIKHLMRTLATGQLPVTDPSDASSYFKRTHTETNKDKTMFSFFDLQLLPRFLVEFQPVFAQMSSGCYLCPLPQVPARSPPRWPCCFSCWRGRRSVTKCQSIGFNKNERLPRSGRYDLV